MYHMFRIGLLVLLLLLTPRISYAQTIHGRVVDTEEEPLPGATVMVLETALGTSTAPDGTFRLEGLEEGTWHLLIRYVGYESRQISVTLPQEGEPTLEITLSPATTRTAEVLVTASLFRRITRYQPSQSYSSADIQQRNTSSLGALIDGEAGVAMRSFGIAPARPVIRGMDGERIQVLQNGMKMGDISATAHDHAVSLDPQSIEQLDVIRGPASLIYGSSAMGGIVNAHSNDIPSGWTAGSSGYVGSEGQSGMASLSGAGRYTYGTDSWAVSVRGSTRNTGDMKTPSGTIPGTDLRALHFATGAAYRGADTHAGASVQFVDQRYGVPEDPFDPDEEVELFMQRYAAQGTVARVLRHDFWEGAEFRASYNHYIHEEIEREYDSEGGYDEDLELSVDQDYAQAELLLQHGSRGILDNGTVGASLEYYRMKVGGDEALTPDARGVTVAGYVVEELALSSNWRLQAGVRLEWNRTESRPNPDFPDAGSTRNQGIWAGAVGVHGSVSDPLRVGFQLSRAHRAPSVEELFSDAIHLGAGAYEIGDPSLDNEIGYGADFFIDYETPARRIHLALYANRITNYITRVPTGENEPVRGLPILQYRGSDADMIGGELVVKQELTRRWSLTGQGDYIRATERNDSRQPLPLMPPLRLKGATEYDTGSWWGRLQVQHVFAQNRVAPAEETTGGYTLTEIAGGVRLGTHNLHQFTVTVENLFDVTWRDHLSRVDQRDIPMMGRNARVSYRYYF
ncbi:TonB-dependent receptor [Balneolales bacterium ANBcel1]|nr:TonB-dependent receptor [Balneolales bacterium ANBcel1]